MKKSTSLYVLLFSLSLPGMIISSVNPIKKMHYADSDRVDFGNEIIRSKRYQAVHNASAYFAARREEQALLSAQNRNIQRFQSTSTTQKRKNKK